RLRRLDWPQRHALNRNQRTIRTVPTQTGRVGPLRKNIGQFASNHYVRLRYAWLTPFFTL
ncbi:MAG: hypothetical protein WD733_23645, partial [Bryobacterales bacterium]